MFCIYRKSVKFYLLLFSLTFFLVKSSFPQLSEGSIIIDKTERTYLIYSPKTDSGKILPLVFVFHGGGGTAKNIMKENGFNDISEKEKFIVVYPNGMNKGWNDGRKEPVEKTKYNDIEFISKLFEKIKKDYRIDTNRIFSTGISNGGFFSFYLAYKLSDIFLAIAPVTANIPENIADEYKPDNSVSLLLINGTEDPLVKYNGGDVGFILGKKRGRAISTDKTIEKFISFNKCNQVPEIEKMPDIDLQDECTSVKYSYKGGTKGSLVVLIKIINGGHTWSGGTQYLPKILIGNLSGDFSASEVIWNFFKNVPNRE
jgi:polyhydroxybutyrate depolymerase